MKKILLAMMLVAAVTAVAQTAAAPASPAPQQSAAPAPAPAPKKEMKDPAEYNAYMGAEGQSDPAAKISGFEAFVTQYPNSAYKEDALEALMGAYQKTNNTAKVLDTAQRILVIDPCSLRALAVLTFTKQSMATGPDAQKNLTDAGQTAEKGLQCEQTATKPDGTTPADWDKLKATTAGIFNNAAGMAAYSAKDFVKAEKYLHAAVAADPVNLTEVYYLALADLSPGAGENDPEGLFYVARAAALQPDPAGKAKIVDFGKKKYTNYHGSADGWPDVLTMANTATTPPADLSTKITKYVPPTPAQQAADLVKTKKVEDMSFAEWQLVLSEGAQEDQDKVWSVLKGKPLQMVGHIISIDSTSKTATKMMLAGSSDDIDAKRADIDLTMSGVIPAKTMPKEDTDFEFQGTPVSYVAKPFVVTMDSGAQLVKAGPKPATTHKKPAAH